MPEPTHLVVGPDEPGNEEFGKLMQEFRIRSQLSRAAVADVLGISSEYLRLVERGKRIPALGRMDSILSLYRITHDIGIDYLAFGTYFIEFTSRIREARNRPSDFPRQTEDRDTQIGKIVRLLTIVDDETLHSIYTKLRRAQ